MKPNTVLSAVLPFLLLTHSCLAQENGPVVSHKPKHTSIYLPRSPINFAALIPPPPERGSAADRADLAAVHAAEQSRTAETIKNAQRDDAEEDIFVYATVLGPDFNASRLPLTAALSLHLRGEAGTVTPPLKVLYGRSRPFVADSSVHAVCERKDEPSYPSGHGVVGYLEGFALAQMLPEHAAEIVKRAQEYAANRVICGVHYPSDVEASRTAALLEFGALSTSTEFQSELAAARVEIVTSLHSGKAAAGEAKSGGIGER